jgi:hypothetical protein
VGDPLFKRRECGGLFEETQYLEGLTIEAQTCRIECGPNSRGDFQMTGGSQDTPNPSLRMKKVPDRAALKVEVAGKTLTGIV